MNQEAVSFCSACLNWLNLSSSNALLLLTTTAEVPGISPKYVVSTPPCICSVAWRNHQIVSHNSKYTQPTLPWLLLPESTACLYITWIAFSLVVSACISISGGHPLEVKCRCNLRIVHYTSRRRSSCISKLQVQAKTLLPDWQWRFSSTRKSRNQLQRSTMQNCPNGLEVKTIYNTS